MKYNFDEEINRIGTNSVKYESSKDNEPELPEDSIPMWIADMDFACPPEVIEAVHKRLDERILGYSDVLEDSYFEILEQWMMNRFGWKINKEELCISAGVVPAISALVQILSKKGERILITTPSYQPFYNVIVQNERIPVYSKLKNENGKFVLDFEDIKEKMEKEDIKVFIFCNPHNPTGRVWEERELRKVAELCMQNSVWLICDEIHQDLSWKNKIHIPMSKLYPEEKWIFTCTAPSKTFNMAGNHMANIFIPNEEIRNKWEEKFYYLPNPLSITATKTAYEKCGKWVDELNAYLDDNFLLVKAYLQEHLPKIDFHISEGTYLAWVDMSGLNLSLEEIKCKFIKEAGLHIETGDMFVENAESYIRMNLACPRSVLLRALERMYKVFKNI